MFCSLVLFFHIGSAFLLKILHRTAGENNIFEMLDWANIYILQSILISPYS